MTYKILEHKQYDAKMEEEKTISIKKKEYDAFLAAIEEADFFKMGSEYRVEQIWRWDDSRKLWNIPSGSSTDGADWILEYCAERSYYINDRRNASATAFGKACIQLIKLSGLKKEKIY